MTSNLKGEVLVTSDLVLRQLTPDDVSTQYVEWLSDQEVNQFLETRHKVQTLDGCVEFIQNVNSDPDSLLFGIFRKDTNSHIGNVKLGPIRHPHRSSQISLFIGEKSSWGLGYGQQVVTSITRFGFSKLELERIEAGCYENNLSSLRMFLKAGYVVEGYFRSSFVFQDKRIGCYWLGALKSEFE